MWHYSSGWEDTQDIESRKEVTVTLPSEAFQLEVLKHGHGKVKSQDLDVFMSQVEGSYLNFPSNGFWIVICLPGARVLSRSY